MVKGSILHKDLASRFDLRGSVAVITGAAGLLGRYHAHTVMMAGGIPVLLDLSDCSALKAELVSHYGGEVMVSQADITAPEQVESVRDRIIATHSRIDILINNAANNPKFEGNQAKFSRVEDFNIESWRRDLDVGLTGAFLCSRIFGATMAAAGKGVILNMSSDLGLIGPDQRIYRDASDEPDLAAVKPVTYSVVKAGLIGLTRYLATYWADKGVRVNAIAPGGVLNGQDDNFVERLSNLIPMGRMADVDEYQAAIAFMISDASSYMTGAVVSIDGGRTAW